MIFLREMCSFLTSLVWIQVKTIELPLDTAIPFSLMPPFGTNKQDKPC